MDYIKKHSFLICSFLSLLLGAIVFISFFGYKIIDPLYIDWIFYSHPDLQETFLGWNYFQHSPWNFPIGSYNALSYPFETSILNTDSIPLFAIFFKLFKSILPDDFQYWGMYVLLCYMLQSFFGMVIVRKFCKNDFLGNLIAILSGLFFVLMPSLTLKAFWHTTSVYHFLILACFVPIIYKFNLKTNIIYFGIVGFLAGSIQPYIVAIDWIIILFYCLYLYINKKDFKQFLPLISYTAAAIFVLYIIGGFLGTSKFTENDLIDNNFNLNGFFNSFGFMRFFNLKYYGIRQSQGFAYFGLGSIVLIFSSFIGFLFKCLNPNFLFKIKKRADIFIITLAANLKNHKSISTTIKKYKKEIILILSLIMVSVVLAVSQRVTYGDDVLFKIPYPQFIMKFWSIFRCTGRFILISNYIILTISMCYIAKHFSRKKLLFLLILALCIQLYDFAPLYKLKNYTKNCLTYNDNTYRKLTSAIKENNIKYIFFDKLITDNIDTMLFSNMLMNVVAQIRNSDIKFNSFYFARKMRNIDEAFTDRTIYANATIFILSSYNINQAMVYNYKIKYFYIYQKLIIASEKEIKGLENYKINKEALLSHSKNKGFNSYLLSKLFNDSYYGKLKHRNINKIIIPSYYYTNIVGRTNEKKFYFSFFPDF